MPIDVTDTSHEFSPTLGAAVEAALGAPWQMESGSPGGDYVTWLMLPNGGSIGVSPHPAGDGLMRWCIQEHDAMGNPLRTEHDLLISEPPEVVARAARRFAGQG